MNARRRWLSRVSWMISRARTGRVAPPHATPGPEMSRLGADGRRPLAAASEYLLPARRERDLVVELRRHAVVAAGLLAGCMLFGGARDIRTARGGEWHHSTVCNRLARARRAD